MMSKEIADKIVSRIDVNDLSEDESVLAEYIGFDKFKELIPDLGGDSYHIKKCQSYKRALKEVLVEEVKVKTVKQLARETGLSRGHILELLREN